MRLSWPNLTWHKASWPARTYHAKTADGSYTYTIDHDGTRWTLRAWCNRTPVRLGYPTARTAARLHNLALAG
ncbi:hypothetical protein [Streptomyces sp. ISL-11]|uniref:hypothetical protein n=1 Tax=Streptomyces sp. ISL-11 TaxID=2819174 RepID=UPI001BEB0DFC|nr:hypothetical protein [Streptomyces sp. ISL-11]MBT2384442.1 hypothetical protein [Streptomyces sp. ISL-11]